MRRRLAATRTLGALGALCGLAGCGIYHTKAYQPNSFTSLRTEDAASASTNCFESSTAVEKAACGVPALAALNLTLTETLQRDLRDANVFSRDALMAVQRTWLLGLPAACHLPDAADAAPSAASLQCLATQFQTQTAALAAWKAPPRAAPGENAIAQYVKFTVSGAVPNADPGFCAALARDANASLSRRGTVDPAEFPGDTEIAGSHGPGSGAASGHRYAVDLHVANAYGSFAQRARAVALDGAPVLDAVSLGTLLQNTAENSGARFSAYASQTGDYGAIDVFLHQGRIVALMEDAWGFNTPAAPGEFAHAGAWDVSTAAPVPLCLFDTFKMPAEGGAFDHLASFTPWRALLTKIRTEAAPAVGVSTLRDQGQLRAEAEWMLLNMPLVVSQQARDGGWTPWLRHRHDDGLDALFAWSTKDAANKPEFDQVFSSLRPAAQELLAAYQQTQALSGDEATQAVALAVMELLYGAAEGVSAGLGADLDAPGSAAGTRPRYPILASPG
jgi:uncharacterized protein